MSLRTSNPIFTRFPAAVDHFNGSKLQLVDQEYRYGHQKSSAACKNRQIRPHRDREDEDEELFVISVKTRARPSCGRNCTPSASPCDHNLFSAGDEMPKNTLP